MATNLDLYDAVMAHKSVAVYQDDFEEPAYFFFWYEGDWWIDYYQEWDTYAFDRCDKLYLSDLDVFVKIVIKADYGFFVIQEKDYIPV